LKCDGTRAETRFRLSAKRTSPFKSAVGASVQSTIGSRGVRISGSNAGYTMFRCSVKSTGCQLHSPMSPSIPLLCVTVCHHISTGVYVPTATWLPSPTHLHYFVFPPPLYQYKQQFSVMLKQKTNYRQFILNSLTLSDVFLVFSFLYNCVYFCMFCMLWFNPLNTELNPICHLLSLLGAHHILHISRVRVNSAIYVFLLLCLCIHIRRSQWPRGLRRRSVAFRLLGLWFLIPPGGMDVCLWSMLCVVR
jgi:hypothetical protein